MSTFISGKYCPLLYLCQWYLLRPINPCRSPYLLITLIGLTTITSDCCIDVLDGVRTLSPWDVSHTVLHDPQDIFSCSQAVWAFLVNQESIRYAPALKLTTECLLMMSCPIARRAVIISYTALLHTSTWLTTSNHIY